VEQLELPKATVSVNGMRDERRDIEYWGLATLQWDGTWQCYANVQGKVCIVQVSLKFIKKEQDESAQAEERPPS
jgi:hypothetical protein